MEQRNDEAMDGSGRIRLNLKKKSNQCDIYIIGATPAKPIVKDPCKRRKLEERNDPNNGMQSRMSLVTCYSRFKKSGVPKRLMFYQNNEWTDFPRDLFDSVQKDLQDQKAIIDVKLNGRHYLLDFLRMFYLDFETGFQKPIAWIDEAGKCFFPKIYANVDDEEYGNDQYKHGRNREALYAEPHKIKLHVEIEVNGLEKQASKEDDGGSNALVERVQNHQKLVRNSEAVGVEDGSNRQPASMVSLPIQERQKITNESAGGKLDIDDVRRMFLEGINSFGNLEILDIYRFYNSSRQTRLELFEKQIEITKVYRGSANVQYAWLASSEQEITNIIMYGLGHCRASTTKSTYGVGIHLTNSSCAYTSASYCEVGENGLRHMILCRVILGNLEAIQRGSTQLHPSSLDYDTGVDDLQNPRHYIVWNFNSTTHIYPEYVVTFKMTPNTMDEGYLSRSEANYNVLGTPLLPLLPVQGQIQAETSGSETGNGAHKMRCPSRIPISPRISFPMLLAAISHEISMRDMEVINKNYQLFQARRMTSDDFIKLLRSMVGDTLLRSAMSRLQAEAQSQQKTVNAVKASKREHGH